MRRKSLLQVVFMVIIAVCLTGFPVQAAASNVSKPDITIKISRLHQFITIIDNLMLSGQNLPDQSPTIFINALLHGTDWIDPGRSIIIGINFKETGLEEKPAIVALLPFIIKNESFKNTYHAVAGSNYYLLSLPPDSNALISDQMKVGLISASLVKPDSMLSVEVAVSTLLQKADQPIQKFLLELDKNLSGMEAASNELTPQDVKLLINNLLNTAKQIDALSMGMDLTQSELNIFSDITALNKSDLSKLLVRNSDSRFTFMKTYKPDYFINFRSNSYNLSGILSFLNDNFGEFYRKIGLDFKDFEKMSSSFTGEMAGGISFRDKGFDYETIIVLKDKIKSRTTFLEDEYLPWLLEYGRKMSEFYNKRHPENPVENFFSMTNETTLSGNRVFGVKGEIPLFASPEMDINRIGFNLRITHVGDFILTASNDEKLDRLIQLVPDLHKQSDSGPLVSVDMDMGNYFKFIKQMMPETASDSNFNFPRLGKIIYTMDMNKGRLVSQYSINMNDIKSIATFFIKNFPSQAEPSQKDMIQSQSPLFSSQPEQEDQEDLLQKKASLNENDAQYWINKGLLNSTYGNNSVAIKYFLKSIDIDPNISSVYFNLGLSYSDQGEYKLAIDQLNQAIALNPDNSEYFYGRGWIYQLSGNRNAAMKDMAAAADLGSNDARKYINKMSR